VAIAQIEILRGQDSRSSGWDLEHGNFKQYLGDLLPVGTDILNRSGTAAPGNPGQAFDTGETGRDRGGRDGVPVFACGYVPDLPAGYRLSMHPAGGQTQHQPGNAIVGYHDVGTAPDRAYGQLSGLRPRQCLGNFVRFSGLEKISGRTTELQSRILAEGDLLTDHQGLLLHGRGSWRLRAQSMAGISI